jgi:hypothetical protein
MAEKNVALELKVEGVNKIIQEVKDLQAEILRLKDILKGVEEGSDAYDTLSQSIQGLEGKLETVKITAQETGVVLENTGTEGAAAMNKVSDSATKAGNSIQDAGKKVKEVNFEKAFQSFVKVGSAVTSSFAAAQSVITTFGGDSTKVAEAAAKAQSLLTVAIAAREVAEGLGAATTVAATIAQKAKNIADNASIGILKRLFAVIAANPYTALALAIGAVVAAFIALTAEESEAEKQAKLTTTALDDLAKATRNINQESEFTTERIRNLFAAFKEGRLSVEAYTSAIEGIIPGFRDVTKYLENEKITKFVNNYKEIISITAKIAEETKTLNSEQLKGDEAAKEKIKQEIKRLDILLANRKNINRIALQEVEDLKKAEEKAAADKKKADEDELARLLEKIKYESELIQLENESLKNQQELGEINVEFATQTQLDSLIALSKAANDYTSIIQEWSDLQKDLSEEDLGRIKKASDEITAAGRKIENINTLVVMGFKKAQVEVKAFDLKELIKEQYLIETGVITDVEKQVNNFLALKKFEQVFIEQYTQRRIKNSKNVNEARKAEEEGYKNEAKSLFDVLVENQKQVVNYEGSIKNLESELKKLTETTENLKNSQNVLNGFIRQNTDDIVNQYKVNLGTVEDYGQEIIKLEEQINSKRFDNEKNYESSVNKVIADLKEQGLDFTNASYEEKLKLLLAYLKKEVKAVEDAEGQKETAEQKRLKKIQDNIAAFQSALNSLQQTTTLFYNAQFDQLEKRNKRVQDTIVGDSEEANKKRLEAEKSYQAEKARIEKQAAKTALRISLAQAIANTAEAVTKLSAITGGVGALIAGGAVVAFNLAQVGIIANQLATIDSYKQGGILKRKTMAGGGLVVGPSHEYGGVKFQGGGIELEGNEAVINRNSTVNYMGLLSQINQSGGGKPIGPGYDDSRLIEAIAKQRNTPIRAYVVESDITAKQQVARRLEKLSQI